MKKLSETYKELGNVSGAYIRTWMNEEMQDECSMECSDCGHFTICYRDFYGNWICGCKHND